MRAHRSLGRALKVVKLSAAKFARPSLAGAVSEGDTQPHSLAFGQAERILHYLTNRRKALSEIRQAIRLSPKEARVHACAATVFEQLHMRDQAIAAVEKALKLGYSVSELQNWPPLERLRLDPRYKRIIAKATEGGSVPISNN